jgi:DNA topoisomerase-1
MSAFTKAKVAMGALFNRAKELLPGPGGGVSQEKRMAGMQKWREAYNPLRGLTIARCVTMLENAQVGTMADVQWTYSFIERTDPDLYALIERRTSAILQLDWNVKKVTPKDPEAEPDPAREAMAEAQCEVLRKAYDRIDNLYEAVEHLSLATFRGFAHVEKHRASDGAIYHLEPCDQWNVVRDGLYGAWKYNPGAQNIQFATLPEANLIDHVNWVIREVKRNVNRIALIKFVRSNLCEKDWDAFEECFGIPPLIVTMPPQVPAGQETEYQEAAASVVAGASGTLPNGSTATFASPNQGQIPFRDRLEWLRQCLVLAGTGGLLTMLTESGSGTLAGNAHADTFEAIARGEARKISEVFQKQVDAEILAKAFPGQTVLAYFELSANEEVETIDIVDQALKLSQAGYMMDPEELSEKTGYTLTLKPAPAPPAPFGQKPGQDPNAEPGNTPEQNLGPDGEKLANRVRNLEVFLNFDPDQERADDGKWTAGAGGGAARSTQTLTHNGKDWQSSTGSVPEHIKKLGIPPAWKDVTVNNNPEANLQAQGTDAKGRRQSIYSEKASMAAAAKKFARNKELLDKQAEVFSQTQSGMKSSDPKIREAASVVSLIQSTGIRPGSEKDTGAEKKAYGATTLEGRHVVVDGDKVRLEFVGKKGVSLKIPVTDPQVATMLAERKRMAGESGKLFATSSTDVLEYSHSLDGGGFKTKDFRTLKGTQTALNAIGRNPTPAKSEKEYKMRVKEIAKEVSSVLGNTPVIALQSYINPFVFDAIKPRMAA